MKMRAEGFSKAEHARYVIQIIEAGYYAAEPGQAQALTTTFTPDDGIISQGIAVLQP
jgi:hypothetical protein